MVSLALVGPDDDFTVNFIKTHIFASFMASKKILSLSAMEKLMKAAGAYRVSEESKEELRSVLEDIGDRISREGIELSRHANRRTIKAGDIKLASKQK